MSSHVYRGDFSFCVGSSPALGSLAVARMRLVVFATIVIPFLLLGFAGNAAAESALTVRPGTISFGTVNVGSRAHEPVKLTNSANETLTITAVAVSGHYFTATGVVTPFLLQAGESTTFTVEFAPRVTGRQTGDITIASKGSAATLHIALSATGVHDEITITPSVASFGKVPIGSSNSLTFKLTNHRGFPIAVSHSRISAAGFSIADFPGPLRIEPGKSATFNVAFRPATPGEVATSVSFASSGPSTKPTTLTIPLSGTGVASTIHLVVNPALLNFGHINVGSDSSLNVVLSNSGNSSAMISRVVVTGSGLSVRGVAVGMTLGPGQTTPLRVTLGPRSTGDVSGSITITGGKSTASIALSGLGVQTASHSVGLSWTPSDSPNIAGYIVDRGTVSGGPYQPMNSSPISGTQYVDTTVKESNSYFYVVIAVASDGDESEPSQQVSVTIPSS